MTSELEKKIAEALQVEDADLFPALDLMKDEYAARLAKAAIAIMDEETKGLREVLYNLLDGFEHYSDGHCQGLEVVVQAENALAEWENKRKEG